MGERYGRGERLCDTTMDRNPENRENGAGVAARVKRHCRRKTKELAEKYFQLAEGFTSGQGGFRADETEGVKYYRMAAELGHDRAQYRMGRIYKYSDPVQAYEWFLEASLLQNTNAMYELYKCYLKGKGVEEDFEEAIKWLKEAAECGYPEACCEYGRRLKHGDGVEKDPKKALGIIIFMSGKCRLPSGILR